MKRLFLAFGAGLLCGLAINSPFNAAPQTPLDQVERRGMETTSAAAAPMLAYPLGPCDARVVQSVGLIILRDGCWIRREQVWL